MPPVYSALHSTPISALIKRPPVQIEASGLLREAIDLLRREDVSCLVVVRDGRAVGILSERDVIESCFTTSVTGVTPVEAVMQADPTIIRPDDTIGAALDLLDRRRVRHVPIVDAEGRPRGIVGVRTIVTFLTEALPQLLLNLAPEPTQPAPTSEGA